MDPAIANQLKELHADYTALEKMQWQLPSKPSRATRHEELEHKIVLAANALSRKISDLKIFCPNHPAYDEGVSGLLGPRGEIQNILFGVDSIACNPYKRF